MQTIISTSEQETIAIGKTMAGKAKPPFVLCLYGDLGSGKTVFCKGFAAGLGIPAKSIKSPTYTLMRKYPLKKNHLYHFDFYRINEADDLLAHDLEEIFAQKNAYIVIEWPERVEKLLPPKRINLELKYQDPTTRVITNRP